MATEPLDDDTLAAIVDADRDNMHDDDLTMEERAHCAHSLRLGEALQQERAAHARTRAELAATRERLGMATCFDVDGYSIWRGADHDWYVANDVCLNLTVDGRWVRPGSETKIEFGKPCRGAEVHHSLAAAFAALAAERKETTP